ncbi:MAG: SGNH/GDSL hydrolase family protein [Lachnospiraceae bacterium]|nr:SGNH/GDSL hydrolase family protein [Lachnospiraceae bacterium]
MRGPAAPKDPVDKRPCLYVVLDKTISGTKEKDGVNRDYVYLEGRLIDQVRFTSGDIDEEILNMLPRMETFRKLVHSVGVSVKAEDPEDREKTLEFQFQCYGKTDKYTTGTIMEMTCPCTGEEMVLPVDAYPVNEDDDNFGSFNFIFPEENKNVTLTIKFYLNDGYEVPEIQVDPPVQFDSDDYKKMIANSLVSTGNNYRLKKVIERAKKGEPVTIAYIGGSITQGAGGKPINTMCYAYHSYEAFCNLFSPCGGDNVSYVKAGVGGTSSEFGMVRYDRDVKKDGEIKPDLVVIEYAVNDEGDETEGVSFESLVLKVLQAENKPAVLLNFAVFMSDWNLQKRLQPIGERYELPMVSVKDAVTPQFEKSNIITKRQFFYDIYHPTNDGHRIMGDCIAHLFEAVDKEEMAAEDISLDKEPVYGIQFKDIVRFDRKDAEQFAEITPHGYEAVDTEIQYVERDMDLTASPEFPDNWMNDGTTENAEFSMKITCKNLVAVIKDSGSSEFGTADIYVDEKIVKSINPLDNGWAHCNAQVLIDEKESGSHEVVFRMKSGDEGKKFTILGFGVTK